MPCKHIYSVAISTEIPLPLAYAEYTAANERGEELFFHHWGLASTKREPLLGDVYYSPFCGRDSAVSVLAGTHRVLEATNQLRESPEFELYELTARKPEMFD